MNQGGGGYYVLNGNFNTSSFAYIAPVNGLYGLRCQVVTDTITSTGSLPLFIFIYINGVFDFDLAIAITSTYATGVNVSTYSEVLVNLQATDVVTFRPKFEGSGDVVIKNAATINGTTYDSFVKLVSVPIAVEGGTVDLSAGNNLLPKEKQVDFIKSIFARYNLIVEIDKDTPKQLNIEPVKDFRDAGVSKDWTDKLDLSKSVIIESTNRFRKAELNLTDKEDEDKINKWWQTKKSQVYNSFKFPFYGDFGSGELKVPSIFSSFAPEKMVDNRMFIAKHFEYNEGVAEVVKVKPKLFYYSGKKQLPPSSNYKILNSITGAYTTKVEYPFCHHYLMAGTLVVSTDTDLRFRSGSILNQPELIETQTINDTYNLYWKNYLHNIYTKDARVQTAYFYLNSQDIADFKYNDKIFLKDSYWLINKIDSFAIGVDNSTKVELLKIVDGTTSEGCSLTRTTSNLDGTTSWVNSSGTAANPTAVCCELEGLTFIGTDCWWQTNPK